MTLSESAKQGAGAGGRMGPIPSQLSGKWPPTLALVPRTCHSFYLARIGLWVFSFPPLQVKHLRRMLPELNHVLRLRGLLGLERSGTNEGDSFQVKCEGGWEASEHVGCECLDTPALPKVPCFVFW